MKLEDLYWTHTWKDLHGLPNGTLVYMKGGGIHLCEISGDLTEDLNWKLQRLSDHRHFYAHNLKKAVFALA